MHPLSFISSTHIIVHRTELRGKQMFYLEHCPTRQPRVMTCRGRHSAMCCGAGIDSSATGTDWIHYTGPPPSSIAGRMRNDVSAFEAASGSGS
jgi:hypothetical protein